MSCPRCQLTSRLKAHQIKKFVGRLWNVAFFVSNFKFNWWSPPPPPMFPRKPLGFTPMHIAHPTRSRQRRQHSLDLTLLRLLVHCYCSCGPGHIFRPKKKTHHKQSRPLARLGHSRTLYTEPRLTRWVKRRHLYCNLSPWEKHRNVPSMF